MNKSFDRYHHWEVESKPTEDGLSGVFWLRLYIGHDPTERTIPVGDGYDGRKLAYQMVQQENQKLRDEGKLYG